jgi:HAD-hyrolase-like
LLYFSFLFFCAVTFFVPISYIYNYYRSVVTIFSLSYRIGVLYEKALVEAGVINPKEYIKSIGKPFDDVYKIALQNVQSLITTEEKESSSSKSTSKSNYYDLSKVCMVGDALETDVAGGTKFGIDTIWVLKDGVYKPDLINLDDNDNNNELLNIATKIVTNFNQLDDTYATGMKLSPTYLLPHFRW